MPFPGEFGGSHFMIELSPRRGREHPEHPANWPSNAHDAQTTEHRYAGPITGSPRWRRRDRAGSMTS